VAVSYEQGNPALDRSNQGSKKKQDCRHGQGRGHGHDRPVTRNVKRFRGGLVFKALRLLYHSTLGLRAIKKKKKQRVLGMVKIER